MESHEDSNEGGAQDEAGEGVSDAGESPAPEPEVSADPPVGGEDGASPPELPSLPARLVAVFVSPGKLMAQLAENPAWVGALLVSAVVIAGAMALVPAELFMEAQREQAMERGMELPEMGEGALRAMRIVIPVTTALSVVIFSFIFAGLYTLIFGFILGDEGRYKQYLSAVVHAWFIAALFSALLTPLRISTGDPQFTLNLASFLFFLPEGYLLNVFRMMDITQIWATLVIAQGAHAIDNKRSVTSAAAIMLAILVAVALVTARFV